MQTVKSSENILEQLKLSLFFLSKSHMHMLIVSVIYIQGSLFVRVEVLRPSQSYRVMSSVVSLPNHKFTGQTYSKRLTSIVHILSPN